ncbi:MAG: HDOD domain-containing protein [Bryobacteraceae bacterium]|nr:HDOD domain-containing protein [Bryobacteraceae bacterium]
MPGVSAAGHEVFLGRQPIFDGARVVHGYELLFRRAGQEGAGGVDGNAATAQVVLNALVEIGIDNLSSGELLFVNCTREALFAAPLFPPERAVLEVLETIELDDALIERIRFLRQSGFRIALDDFVWDDSKANAVAEADYVKLDVQQLDEPTLRRHIPKLKRYSARIIAEKIESEEQMQMCRNFGIDLFQGYFLRRPDVIRRKSVPASRLAALQIVAQCQNPNITLQKLASTISSDVALAWGLLRLSNTLLYSGAAPVETLLQAVGRLGTQKVMRWAVLLTIAGQQDCPRGYLQLSLQRAFMCEELARRLKTESPDAAFLVGLLSLLDAIVEVPMKILIRQLPLAPRIRNALVDFEGPCGAILSGVLAWEHGDWEAFAKLQIPHNDAMSSWLHSLGMSAETLKALMAINKPDPVKV